MNEKLKELRKQKYAIIDKRDYLRSKMKNLQLLQPRATCPTCEQNVKNLVHNEDIKKVKVELETTYKELDDIIAIMQPLNKNEHQISERTKEIMRSKIVMFYLDNKKLLSKANKDYYAGITPYMPTGFDTISDKTLWNRAMEVYFNRCNKPENDELLFEV